MKRMAEASNITIGEMLPMAAIQLDEAMRKAAPVGGGPENPVAQDRAHSPNKMLESALGELAKAKRLDGRQTMFSRYRKEAPARRSMALHRTLLQGRSGNCASGERRPLMRSARPPLPPKRPRRDKEHAAEEMND